MLLLKPYSWDSLYKSISAYHVGIAVMSDV